MKARIANAFIFGFFSIYSVAAPFASNLGDGYPGRIESYTASLSFQKQLDGFSLKAAWFRRDNPPPDQYFNPVLFPVNGNKGAEFIDTVAEFLV